RTTQQALEYRERILRALPPRTAFEPLMTLYLTDDTPPEEIALAKRSGQVFGVKLYPAGATTHSDEGVTRLSRCFHALEKMTEVGMPLLIHGESTDPAIDVFDREKAFIEEVLGPLVERFPQLKVVLEHITTRDAVQYIEVTGPNIAATITAHHLLMNRNALFMGGIRPHHYCLPVLKREDHREALVEAAASGNPKFFLGTDSAPHARHAKETACGCAGIYTAHAAIEFYAIAFEEAGALGKLEGFASVFGPGCVETRPESLHDLFNALAWLAFPRTKARINAMHAERIPHERGRRGRLRDLLTLFDEGGAIVACADAELLALLRGFRWKELFWEHRGRVLRSMRISVLGHAVLEKALDPWPGITCKAIFVAPGADADAQAAAWL